MTTTALPAWTSAIARSMLSSITVWLPISRSTYLASTSTSRFTGSPGCFAPSVVARSVSGIRPTSNQSAPTALTVSDTPSTAIEPFSAM